MQFADYNKAIFLPRFFILSMCSGCLYSSICWLALDQFCFVETSLVIMSVFYVYIHLTMKVVKKGNSSLKEIIKNLSFTFFPKNHLDSVLFLFLLLLLFLAENPIYWLCLFVLISLYSLCFSFLNIRNNAIGKPLFIALCWTLILFEPVLRSNDLNIQIQLYWVILLHFLYFFILSVIDDFKDFSLSESGIKSMPIKYEFAKVRGMLMIVLLVFYISCLFFKPVSNFSFVVCDFILFGSLFLFLLFAKRLSYSYIWLIELHLGLLGLEYFFLPQFVN